MLLFLDSENKIIYIMAPKCGTNTIANMLNVSTLDNYLDIILDNNLFNNPEYKKIIIVRKSIIDRFLSGFYEDLCNNTCYNNINITFNDYLLFLYKCYNEKIPNVNNLDVYNGLNIPVWFGNCSDVSLNITDTEGNFCSHIMSQKYAISQFTNLIKCKNLEIWDLNDLSILLPNLKKCNVKNIIHKLPDGFDSMSNILLSDMKTKKILLSKDFLNETHKKIILEIYKEDIIFFNELENKFLRQMNDTCIEDSSESDLNIPIISELIEDSSEPDLNIPIISELIEK